MHTSDETLLQLLQGVSERNHHFAETGEDIDASTLIPKRKLTVPELLRIEWGRFEAALRAALIHWLTEPQNFSGLGIDGAEALTEALMSKHDAAYAVFMTLNGEGVGIWDGRWSEMFSDTQIDTLKGFLSSRLDTFADYTGGGSLNEAFDSATYRS